MLAVERHYSGTCCVFLGLLDGAIEVIAPSLPQAAVEEFRRVAFRVMSHLNQAGEPQVASETSSLAEAMGDDQTCRAMLESGLQIGWAAPVRSSRGDCLGALLVSTRGRGVMTAEALEAIGLVQKLSAVAVEHRQLCAAMSHQAMHDPLTGLLNQLL